MFAMIRHYRTATASTDDVMHTVDTQFADQLQQQLGIIAYQAVDVGGGEIVTITVFETEPQLRAAQGAAEGVRRTLAEFHVEQIGALAGEVMISRADERVLQPVRP